MDFEARFWDFVHTKKLFDHTHQLLLAVSGGLDSMTLLHLLHKRHEHLAVAHCNFQLRGEESDGDAAFVRAETTKRGVPFFEKNFDTQRYATENDLSVQMAARALRYAWFDELCDNGGFDKLVTAHHLDDHVETAWLHFIRGTGLRGLAGMPVVNGRLVRPLLFASREEVAAYAEQEAIRWREDSSNAQDYYARNYLRLQLIPGAKALNPNFLHTASRSMDRFREAADNLEFLLDRFVKSQSEPSGVLRWLKADLENLPGRLQALTAVFQPLGFDEEQMRQLSDGWHDTGKQWSTPSGARLLNDRKHLIFEPVAEFSLQRIRIDDDDLMVRLPGFGTLFMMPADPAAPMPDGRDDMVTPAKKLVFPLIVRPWAPGDAFQPFGMGGKRQKLQDFLTNAKLSRLEKERTLVLENGNGDIIWVIGRRTDERYRVEARRLGEIRFKFVDNK